MRSSSRPDTRRSLTVHLLKFAFGVALLIYLVRSDMLDVYAIASSRFLLGLLVVLAIQVVIFLITNYRWYVLAGAYRVGDLRYRQCLFYSWIGQFFTTFLPAYVAADFSKIYYLRRHGFETKPVLRSVVMDRAASLGSLILLCVVAIPAVVLGLSLWYFLVFLVGIALMYHLFWSRLQGFSPRWAVGLSLPPTVTILVGFVSFPLKSLSLVYILALTGNWPLLQAFYLSLAGQLFEVVPLTPANLGIGHLAFDLLYKNADMGGGAEVYSVYFLAKILFKLSGFIGWLRVRKHSWRNPLQDCVTAYPDEN